MRRGEVWLCRKVPLCVVCVGGRGHRPIYVGKCGLTVKPVLTVLRMHVKVILCVWCVYVCVWCVCGVCMCVYVCVWCVYLCVCVCMCVCVCGVCMCVSV